MAPSKGSAPRRVEWAGVPSAENVIWIRRQIHETLARWELPADVIDDVVLVATELLANVVDHARTAFHLVVELRGRMLHLAVDDELRGPAPAGTAATVAGHVGGLHVVNVSVLRWGWEEHDTGKTVWAEFLT